MENKPKSFPASIGTEEDISEGPLGQKAHRETIAHTERLERKLYEVRPGVWSQVGNGLSNQNFIEGPEGLIVIDTGAVSYTHLRAHETLRYMVWPLGG